MPTSSIKVAPAVQLDLHQTTLGNGLRVCVSPDHASPTVAVNLWYDVGSSWEAPGRTGLAHLFEHLMFEGSANVAPGEHFALIQQAGGVNNATTAFDRTNYFQCVTAENLDLVLWLEADRMGSLLDAVTQESLDKQRGIVKNERRQRFDSVPYGTAFEQLHQALFPAEHPYHHTPIGSMQDLEAASLDDVHAFFQRHYAPNYAVLSVVGPVDPEAVFARVEHFFGAIAANPNARPAPKAGPVRTPAGTASIDALVPEEGLFLAYPLPAEGDPGLAALDVGVTALSRGRGGAFHRNIVRAELTTQVSATVTRAMLASTAIFAVLGKNGASPDAALAAVQAELRRFIEVGPDPAELARAKAQRLRLWLERLADPTARADLLSQCATQFGDPGHALALLEEEQAVDAEAVQAAFAAAFDGVAPATVAYHPSRAGAGR